MGAVAARPAPAGPGATEGPIGESRRPPLVAVLVFMALNIALRVWLPGESAVDVPWLVPAIEAVLLVVLFTSNPDYLHLGFTNATAFSPTDVMPLTHRAKYAMLVQSTVALVVFGLIVARAVNAFT